MEPPFANWLRELGAAVAALNITWLDLLAAFLILAAFAAAALLFSRVIFRLLLRAARLSRGGLDDCIVAAARAPVIAYIILLGLYLAIAMPLTLPPAVDDAVNRAAAVAAVIIGAALLNAIAAAGPGSWALPLVRRGALALLFAMAAMVCLDILGINISPLIAGLGIGGLAVALALQPTLSKLFAGTYVITEGVVSAGDYIEMENGITGYVVDVNWRSTRLRTWTNNLVIIPNARFSETIITNYSKPDEYVNVYLTCGVAYESDLPRVEEVSVAVMRELESDHQGVVPGYGVYFGYDNFGDSNINFWLFMQANSRLASFEVRSELIKRLHARLSAEGITINYPVRTLHFPNPVPAAPPPPPPTTEAPLTGRRTTGKPSLTPSSPSPADTPGGSNGATTPDA